MCGADCRCFNESTRPSVGLGERSVWHESRFLGEYPCGGHAGLGHHRRAVGDQDLLRHVEQAGAAVGDTDLSLSRFATGAPFRGGGSLLFSAVALLEFIRGYVVVASIGQRFPLSCNSFQGAHALKALPKRFTPSALPQPLAKIIDVESNAAQRSHQRYHPCVVNLLSGPPFDPWRGRREYLA